MLRIALAQINSTVGDLEGNQQKIPVALGMLLPVIRHAPLAWMLLVAFVKVNSAARGELA